MMLEQLDVQEFLNSEKIMHIHIFPVVVFHEYQCLYFIWKSSLFWYTFESWSKFVIRYCAIGF